MRGPNSPTITRRLFRCGAVALVVLSACSSRSGDSDSTVPPSTESDRSDAFDIVPLAPLRAESGRIVDDRNRTILLRGANANALGEYFQGDPAVAPTAPLTGEDWDAMAANGFSVVRLIISWSRLEPERGQIDASYIEEIRGAVDAANRRGIYVVLDMHQDAWGLHIATPPGTSCPDGTERAVGWDGAPMWATLTDGATTCRSPGSRESAPAVQNAFRNFYANTDGIRDNLVAVWAHLATEFSGIDGVAGYELLNEPNLVQPAPEANAGYNRFLADAISAIREAEASAGVEAALIFVEPIVLYPLPDTAVDPDVVSDEHLVFAPHNYAESIGPKILTVEQTFALDEDGADALAFGDSPAPLWIGEYGYWNTSEDTLAVARRFAAAEDEAGVGGAWWQWRQTCGDPHAVGTDGGAATDAQVHLIERSCPEDVDAGFTRPFLDIVGRSYPRAAPGFVDILRSDPVTGAFELEGSDGATGDELVIWVPRNSRPADADDIDANGLRNIEITDVNGGSVVSAVLTQSDYSLSF